MSAVPELKQKKIARDQAIAEASKKAAAKAVTVQAEYVKSITAKAAAYEAEYAQVFTPSLLACINFIVF